MSVQQVLMFKDNKGQLWENQGLAESANGVYVLAEHLRSYARDKQAGAEEFTISTICQKIADWYSIYLEGTRA